MNVTYKGKDVTVFYEAEGNDKFFEHLKEQSKRDGLVMKLTLDE